MTPLALEEIPNRQWAEWFLNDKDDLRSSYFLELTATEFDVQGLELDWVCLAWGGDFQFDKARQAWSYRDLRGSKWNEVRKQARRIYRKNAYRVLMTRARQGMVIYVPEGTNEDPTRLPEFYDNTFAYLDALGIEKI